MTYQVKNSAQEIFSRQKSGRARTPIKSWWEAHRRIGRSTYDVHAGKTRQQILDWQHRSFSRDKRSLRIVDYKTGYKNTGVEDIADIYDLQMKIYAYGVLSAQCAEQAKKNAEGQDKTDEKKKDSPKSVYAYIVCPDKNNKIIDGTRDASWRWNVDDMDALQKKRYKSGRRQREESGEAK